ncbi:hypothetical protein A3A76_03500 [Candidatus Woesebacteria bacterium RIFCSPLOWO2_01_FULL_39_23]|uniref:Cell division protein FtsL n=1 Tax=Candidatus Woesebacteria bacterium RIFCSPHIGHO2_01_FULL_40_22 TaxID=1802499 RepID=A0A1F7YJJ3_9BACT|nr:MAG: hypothetical protein A2141_00525 [Candidatus Woesebacteria bacterium RBG_16_40_11]OGM27521.1 MAG: hypothetical protein A2628_01900 [Candidatus Woesebacteria bacterium RIFCSPHIGHO2_01_FULL_40_22]OGM36113.1 MAG: hypothetical protein A3E41_02140 [Candidatus Woesebacteria bacterium RIFCSPHIGHO2_12_FULL_38_9]OGM62695.1 MAG: hypothetical protein A3A76_03500 [Candidatus Woesebacteria bacterium RIFCSPLOWO2_01_FULL_39_23]
MRIFKVKKHLESGNKRNWVLLSSLSVFVILIISTVVFTIYTASLSDRVILLDKKELTIILANNELNHELVELSSLTKLNEESNLLGFIRSSSIFYIKSEESIAKLP